MQPSAPRKPGEDDPAIVQLVREAADRHGVPRRVALAFAWCESRLIPTAQGDLKWHERDGGRLYRERVQQNPRFRFNPARDQPERWHSYGLFQLLACYHVLPNERPERLLEPAVNAERGCAEIARLLMLARGDEKAARLKYIGCGFAGSNCAREVVADTLQKLERALRRYEHEGQP